MNAKKAREIENSMFPNLHRLPERNYARGYLDALEGEEFKSLESRLVLAIEALEKVVRGKQEATTTSGRLFADDYLKEVLSKLKEKE